MGTSVPSWALPRIGFETPWLITGAPLSSGRHEQVSSVVVAVAETLGWARRPPAAQVTDCVAALAVLARAWQDVTDALAAGSPGPERLGVLVGLLRDIRTAEDGVRDDQATRQASGSEAVREALSGLRDVHSVAELAARAPGAAAMVGFDRVLLSRIEESAWVPESMFVANDAKWADEILEAGREDLRTLDSSLLETQIVRRNRPLVVADTARPDLHRALIEVTQTRSYAAAPVVGWGRVIGFLHADCYRQRRQLDRADRDLLWMFCDGLGHLVVRTAAMDALHTLRGELDRLAGRRDSFGTDAGWPAVRADSPVRSGQRSGSEQVGAGRSAVPDFFDEVEGALTRREVEVMRLMGAGHTNAQIARRLVISEGTVKSHVKHILRKLQAANRAEAVSRWLREEHARHLGRERPERAGRIGA
jgi:DNA-binding CsgD family transcriptional regulator